MAAKYAKRKYQHQSMYPISTESNMPERPEARTHLGRLLPSIANQNIVMA